MLYYRLIENGGVPSEMGRRPLLAADVKITLTATFDKLAMSSELPPKESIPLIFQAAQQAAQPNPALPVKKPSETTFLRNAFDVFGTRKTVPGKARNQNRVSAMADPRAVISHALVTAAGFRNIEPQFAGNCDTVTIAMGPRIGDAPRRTRITQHTLKVISPLPTQSALTSPILIR